MNDVEQVLISKVINDGDYVSVIDAGVLPSYFTGARWQKSWAWIADYWSKHNAVPSLDAFKRNFPSYALGDADDEPLSAVIEELRLRRTRRIVQDGIEKSVNLFDNDAPPAKILEVIKGIIATANIEVAPADIVSSADCIGPLITKIISMETMELLGIPTGFPTIDRASGGLQKEQFIVVGGLPKTGKSSIAMAVCRAAQNYGMKVGLASFEMSNIEQQYRYVSQGAGVSLTGIMRGQLNSYDRKQLERFELEVLDLEAPLVFMHDVSSIMTVSGLSAKQSQHDFDLLVVDGVYLMQDDFGEKPGSPQALTNISRGLKRLGQQHKIPVFATTQFLHSKVGSTGSKVDSFGYTSAWLQDADCAMGLDRPDLNLPQAKLKILAARNSVGVETDIIIDWDIGRVEEQFGGGYSAAANQKEKAYGDDID